MRLLKQQLLIIIFSLAAAYNLSAQKISFTEYDLSNGLHVILHKDTKAPVVAISVYYHVGSKNEDTARTGFAHFFEHLLFHGSENIKKNEFSKYVSSNGGRHNATTSQDRTLYYELFPSNQLELGLWLESERMLHPVIDDDGVHTENEVVKEEKRLRYDNSPYGHVVESVMSRLFTTHPYRWMPIGSQAHLDAASLDEFKAFFKKYYVPNNATLSIAGDINIDSTKEMVATYFTDIPGGKKMELPSFSEQPLEKLIIDTVYDANIQLPAIVAAYRIPGKGTRDAKVLDMLTRYLSGGASSKLYKKMVDDKKNALQVGAFSISLEDFGAYMTFAIPNNNTSLTELLKDVDEEVLKVQQSLISEEDYQKLMNQVENDYVSTNSRMLSVAENLAENFYIYGNTAHINQVLDEYRKITRQDMMDVAKKYLVNNRRLILYYLPQPSNN